MQLLRRASLTFLVLLSSLALTAQEKKALPRIDPDGISGSLVIGGGGKLPNEVYERFVELAGGDEGHLVVIPTASASAGKEGNAQKLQAEWKDRKLASVAVLHARSREQADDPEFVAPLKKATAVWFGGGSQSRIAEAYLGTLVEKELYALLKRGGVIGGTSAGAAIQTRVMIASGNGKPMLKSGLDLLPNAIVDQHFTERKREKRLVEAVQRSPGCFGVGIDEGTAVIVRGRLMRAYGDGNVTIYLGEGAKRKPQSLTLKGPRRVADLTALRRAARDRLGEPFPPEKPASPEVEKGSLVIVGGGALPRSIVARFIELAGGPDALIVVLPTAVPARLAERSGRSDARFLQRFGAKNVKVLAASKLEDVEDPKNLEVLKQAKGLWFGGGRQWRFFDAYEGTKALPIFHDVLKRGGVIGGSSAGASIQAEYLARGHPLGNREVMADGYERGFGFLRGVAVDQHFSQRKRFADMTSLVTRYPQLLGIGIDEATALIVRGHAAQIMGRGKAHFYDRGKPVKDGEPDYVSVKAGDSYDLRARKAMPAEDKKSPN